MQRSQLTVRSILSRRAILCEETERFLQISNVFGLVFPLKKTKKQTKITREAEGLGLSFFCFFCTFRPYSRPALGTTCLKNILV